MRLEEITILFCEQEHRLYIPNDQLETELDDIDVASNMQCLICGGSIVSETSKTILIADNYEDTVKLLYEYEGEDK